MLSGAMVHLSSCCTLWRGIVNIVHFITTASLVSRLCVMPAVIGMQHITLGNRECCLMSPFVSERHSSSAPPPATNCGVWLRALSANGEPGRHTSLLLWHWSFSERPLLSSWLFDQSHIVLVCYIQEQGKRWRNKSQGNALGPKRKSILVFA